MDDASARQLIDRYWQAANERDFDSVGALFTDDVLIEWPQSGERVRGKEACISVWLNYPGGSPRFQGVNRVVGDGNVWLAETLLDYPDGKRYIAVGVFVLQDGKIAHEIDYFNEPFPAPEWRRQWVEPMA